MRTNDNAAKLKNNYFDGIKVTKRHFLVFVLVASAYFFEVFDQHIFNYTAPAVMASLGLATADVGKIASLYYLGNTFGAIFGGIISDIIGRRKSLLLSIFLFSSGTVLNGITNNPVVFMVARTLTGFGILCMMVVTITYMAEMSPKETRGKWEAIISGIGYSAAPLIGVICGIIVPLHAEAWRYVYYMSGISFVFFIVALFTLKESPRWLMSRGRLAEAEEVVSSLTGQPVDLSEVTVFSGERNKLSKVIRVMFSSLYLRRTIVLAVVLSSAVVAGQIALPWMTTLLKMSGYSMRESILLTTIANIGVPLGMFTAAIFTDKGGRRIPIAVFGTLNVIVLIPFILIVGGKGNFWLVALFAGLMNLSAVARNFMIHPYVAESLPTKLRNSMTGILNGLSRFLSSGVQLIVPMLFAGYGFAGVFGLDMGLSALCVFVVLVFGWRAANISLEDLNEDLTLDSAPQAESDKPNA